MKEKEINREALIKNLGTTGYSERVNEMYWMYASLYLDCADNNLSHFWYRDKDIQPLREAESAGLDISDDEVAYRAYMSAAKDLAEEALDMGAFESLEDIYEEYPLLRGISTPICSKKSIDEIKECAVNAFETTNWIIGAESGGIEPIRNILAVDTVQDAYTVKVLIDWDYPPTCGLSDCRYHVEDNEKIRRDTFIYYITMNTMYLLTEDGEEEKQIFQNLTLWLDESKKAAAGFYETNGLEAPVECVIPKAVSEDELPFG